MSACVLELRNLTKTLESGFYRFDLFVPKLSLEPARFYGLTGKSGSGKSTMLDLLAMVSAPTAVEKFEFLSEGGAVDIAKLLKDSNDVAISDLRLRNFGYVLQSGGLFPFLTVRGNLELPFRLAGREVSDRELVELTCPFEMDQHLDKYPHALSGGQRQRVSVIRALCISPAIVLADEPTASVDENMADAIVGELKQLAASKGTTVLMVSHDMELVAKFADEIFSLRPEPVEENHIRSEMSVVGV